MAIEHKAGTALDIGTVSIESNDMVQTLTLSAAGELKIFKDRQGNDVSAYLIDGHKEYSGEMLVTDKTEKNVGDDITINGTPCVITKWDVVCSNADATKVSFSARQKPVQ